MCEQAQRDSIARGLRPNGVIEVYDLAAVSHHVQGLGGSIQAIQPLREDLEQIFIRDTSSTTEPDTAS